MREKKAKLPYVAASTLLEYLRECAHSMPIVVDSTTMLKVPKQAQAQIVTALAFLQLIDDAGQPTALMESYCHATSQVARKELMRRILENSYSFYAQLDLRAADSATVEKCFADAEVTGDTKQKCIRLFVELAKQAGDEISPLVRTGRPSPAGTVGAVRRSESGPKLEVRRPAGPGTEPVDARLAALMPPYDHEWPLERQLNWARTMRTLVIGQP